MDFLLGMLAWLNNSADFLKADIFDEKNEDLSYEFFSKTLTDKSCENNFSPFFVSSNNLQKETIIMEIEKIIKDNLDKNFEISANTEILVFEDLDENDKVLDSAKFLRSLGILEKNNPVFGDKNKTISKSEFLQIFAKSFDKKECGFRLNQNKDNDNFLNKDDLCPNIFGENKGCPNIILNKKTVNNSTILKNFYDDFEIIEKTEIKIGDEFSAGVFDSKTKKIIYESNKIKVLQ